MHRLYVKVDNMFIDCKEMVKFWHKFMSKYQDIKTAMEKAVIDAKISNNTKAVKLDNITKVIYDIVGHEGAPYYYVLVVHPRDCGVWSEYNDCCTLEVHTCNVGG